MVKPTVRQIIAKCPLPIPRQEDAACGGDFRDMAFREVHPIHIMYHSKMVRMRAMSGIDVRPYDGNPASDDHQFILSRKEMLPGSLIFLQPPMIASCRVALSQVGR
jgi:hypothetical protein